MKTFLILLVLLHTHLIMCNGFSFLGINLQSVSDFDAMVRRVCAGNKIRESCSSEIESESNKRRVLVMEKRYISYGTLKGDSVPCPIPGASYYNCRAAGEANPYHRGCEVITGCARDISRINY